MKLGEGVEQAIHSVAMLAGLQPGSDAAGGGACGVSRRLAELSAEASEGAVRAPASWQRCRVRTAATGWRAPPDRDHAARHRACGRGPAAGLPLHGDPAARPEPAAAACLTRPCEINAAMLKAERAYRAELRQGQDRRHPRRARTPMTRTAASTRGAAPSSNSGSGARPPPELQHSKTKGKTMRTPPQHRQSRARSLSRPCPRSNATWSRRVGLTAGIIHLIKMRASQINGCAYCVDMHVKEARRDGFGEQWMH